MPPIPNPQPLSAIDCRLADAGGSFRGRTPWSRQVRSLPVPGATITATMDAKKAVTTTDDQGVYTFPDLDEGVWKMQVEMLGFETVTRDIAVAPDAPSPAWDLKLLSADGSHDGPGGEGRGPPPAVVAAAACRAGYCWRTPRPRPPRRGLPRLREYPRPRPTSAATTPAPNGRGGRGRRAAADAAAAEVRISQAGGRGQRRPITAVRRCWAGTRRWE